MMTDAAPAGLESQQHLEDDNLSLTAFRFGYRTGAAGILVGGCAIALAPYLWRDDEIGLWTWVWVVPFLVVAAGFILWDLFPVRLVANTHGLTWRSLEYNRTIPWSDIEAIGIARPTGTEGWEHPVVRILSGHSRSEHDRRLRGMRQPSLGVTLKPGRGRFKDPATRAYQLGFHGYELGLPAEFDMPLTLIVDDLQARLARSRETTPA